MSDLSQHHTLPGAVLAPETPLTQQSATAWHALLRQLLPARYSITVRNWGYSVGVGIYQLEIRRYGRPQLPEPFVLRDQGDCAEFHQAIPRLLAAYRDDREMPKPPKQHLGTSEKEQSRSHTEQYILGYRRQREALEKKYAHLVGSDVLRSPAMLSGRMGSGKMSI